MKLLKKLAFRAVSVVIALSLALLLFAPPSQAVSPQSAEAPPAKGRAAASPEKILRPEKGVIQKKEASYEPGKILVRFKSAVSEAAKEKLHRKHGSKKVKVFKALNVHHLKIKDGLSVAAALELYRNDPDVLYAEPDYRVSASSITPNDTYYSSSGSWGQPYQDLWGLYKINAGAAWDVTQGSADVVVAVVDSGIDFNHPDLQGKIWTNPRESAYDGIDDDSNSFVDDLHGWNFVAHNNNPVDDKGHGTHVSGTIAAAANNGTGVPGISWQSKIMPLKFLDAYGWGTSADGAAAVIYAADNGAKVINLSVRGEGRSQTMEDAINYAFNKGVVVVTGAGNGAANANFSYPAAYENVITVGATDRADNRAYFSNYGPAVEVAAPGDEILSLRAAGTDYYGNGSHVVGGGYYRDSGTSMAAAHVSGVAALLFAQHPEWSNRRVLAQIVGTTDTLAASDLGTGRINAFSALTQIPSKARLTLLGYRVDDQSGNGDGKLDAGETVSIVASVKNYSFPANATITLATSDPYVTIVSGSASLGALDTWQGADNALSPFVVAVSPEAPRLHKVSFTLTIAANDGSYTNPVTLEERVTPNLPGWPVRLGAGAWGPVTVADLDGDGHAETVTVSDKIYVVRGDGTPLPGWPKALPSNVFSQTPVSIGDLDGNGRQVLVVSGGDSIHAWYGDGSVKEGFPIIVPGDGEIGIYPNFLNTTLADLDGDGKLEIMATSYWQGKVYAWRHNGMPAPGWPVSVPAAIDYLSPPMVPAVGDLDGDGKPEFIVPWHNAVYAWRYDATPAAGWPVATSTDPTAIATGDFAHDGSAKVVVSGGGSLSVYNGDGSLVPGWPQPGNMPAIGDVDQDGELEIVSDIWGAMLVFRLDGSMLPGWPRLHDEGTSLSPLLADVDGDGRIDIVARTTSGIEGWRADGSVLPEFPIRIATPYARDVSAALADINGDGMIDLVTPSGDDADGKLYAYPLPGQYQRQLVPWAMYGHDARHSFETVPAPVIAEPAHSGLRGLPFSRKLGARGGYAPYAWEISSGALPPGLSLNTATGEISGTPLQAGIFQCTARVSDPYSSGTPRAVTVTIDVVAITTPSLLQGTVGGGYYQTVAASGGTAPYSWSVVAGSLPSGLTLDAATGTISGSPTTVGTATFTVQAADAGGNLATREFRVEVITWNQAPEPGLLPERMVVDEAGNLYMTGVQLYDYRHFTAKYDPAGRLVWRQFLTADSVTGLVVDAAGRVYTAGDRFETANSFVSKYDSDGSLLWTRDHYIAGNTSMTAGLAVDPSGNVYASGRPGRLAVNDSFLLKYDAAGELQWEKSNLEWSPGPVAVRGDGNIYLSLGGGTVLFDPAGNVLSRSGYGDSWLGMVVDADNNLITAGWGLGKYDPAGNMLWSVYLPQNVEMLAMAVDSKGNVYMTGNLASETSVTAITRKYDRDGNEVWTKEYETTGLTGSYWPRAGALAVQKNSTAVYVGGANSAGKPFLVRYIQPAVTTPELSDATVQVPYTQALTAQGGTGSYSWSVVGGLPSGLTMDATTGTISGIPWVAGGYQVRLKVTDAAGMSDVRSVHISVHYTNTTSLTDFTATTVLGEAPLLVEFSDASSNVPAAWSWIFGDGGSGDGRMPSHLYTTPGTYTVSLTTMGENGSGSASKEAFITVLACGNGNARLLLRSPDPFAGLGAAYRAAIDRDIIFLLAGDTREVIEMNRDIKVTLKGGFDCSYNESWLPTTLAGLRLTAGTVMPENLHLR